MIMTSTRYTFTAIRLHWLVTFLIIIAFPLGIFMSDMALSPLKLQLISYHKWLGITIFLFAVIRLIWRVKNPPPPLPESLLNWQKTVTHVVHYLLYVLIFAIPLTGWLMSSAKGFQTVYFGVLPLPDLIGKDKELGDLLKEVHEILNFTMLGLVIAHAAAALKHHFIEHDDILVRMLPFLDKNKS